MIPPAPTEESLTVSRKAETSSQRGLSCIRLRNRYEALGLAANMLAKAAPYDRYPVRLLVPTLMAEIRREHYCFTISGGRVLAYAGWAMCSHQVALDWVEGCRMPDYSECVDGDTPVLLTFYSKSAEATRFQIRYLRTLCPGKEVFFRREYADGRPTHSAGVLNVFEGERAALPGTSE